MQVNYWERIINRSTIMIFDIPDINQIQHPILDDIVTDCNVINLHWFISFLNFWKLKIKLSCTFRHAIKFKCEFSQFCTITLKIAIQRLITVNKSSPFDRYIGMEVILLYYYISKISLI